MKIKNLVLAGAGAAVAVAGIAAPANAASESTWDALAQCESGGNWGINTGNGFGGGLQFVPSTWAAYGGTGSSHTASKAEQIRVAENVLKGQGWGAWPACSAKLGLSGGGGGYTPQAAPAPKAAAVQAPKIETPVPAVTPQKAEISQAPVAAAPAPAPVVTEAPATPAAVPTLTPQAPVSVPVETPAPVAEAPAQASGSNYIVKAGDTLAKIAAMFNIQGGFQTLLNLNPHIEDANLIFVGQTINLG